MIYHGAESNEETSCSQLQRERTRTGAPAQCTGGWQDEHEATLRFGMIASNERLRATLVIAVMVAALTVVAEVVVVAVVAMVVGMDLWPQIFMPRFSHVMWPL